MLEDWVIDAGGSKPTATYNVGTCVDIGPGNLIWTAGRTGKNDDGKLADGAFNQTKLALEGVNKVFQAKGGSLENATFLYVGVVDLATNKKFVDQGYRHIMEEFGAYPARHQEGVTEFPLPGEGALVMIWAQGYIPHKK